MNVSDAILSVAVKEPIAITIFGSAYAVAQFFPVGTKPDGVSDAHPQPIPEKFLKRRLTWKEALPFLQYDVLCMESWNASIRLAVPLMRVWTDGEIIEVLHEEGSRGMLLVVINKNCEAPERGFNSMYEIFRCGEEVRRAPSAHVLLAQ